MKASIVFFILIIFGINCSAQKSKFHYTIKKSNSVLKPLKINGIVQQENGTSELIKLLYIFTTKDRDSAIVVPAKDTIVKYGGKDSVIRLDERNSQIRLKGKETTNPIYMHYSSGKCIIKLDGQGVPVVDFWQYEKEDTSVTNHINPSENVIGRTNLKNGKIVIDLSRNYISNPTRVVKVPFSQWIFGIGVVPFRFRLPFDTVPLNVTSNLAFVANFGYTWGSAKITNRAIIHKGFTIAGFVGLSQADLKKTTMKDVKKYSYDQSNLSIPFGLNFILSRNNLGLSAALGWDFATGRQASQWLYQGKKWIGFGVIANLAWF